MRYKKKPVEIDAIQYTGTNNDELKEFVGHQLSFFNLYPVIKTLEGNMTVSIGDYVIKGVKGEFYPCKSDIFEETYELVE